MFRRRENNRWLRVTSKLLKHMRSGTVISTSNRWLHSRFESARWRFAGYSIVPLDPCGSIKLYRDSRLSELIRYGDFERSERTFALRFLRPNDVFVDIGANVGLYTILAAGLVSPGGRVISFEPCHRTYSRLVENIRRNGYRHVSCVNAALSDSPGVATLYAQMDDKDAWNSLCTPENPQAVNPEQITTLTWDDYSAEHGLQDRIALMKIDVEGWEETVLRGAKQALLSPGAPVLQVEFCEENARMANSSCESVFDALLRLGYKVYEYDADENHLKAVPKEAAMGNRNLYALKDLDSVLSRLNSATSAIR